MANVLHLLQSEAGTILESEAGTTLGWVSDDTAQTPLVVPSVRYTTRIVTVSLNTSQSGDNTVFQAKANQSFQVLYYLIVAASSVGIRWYSATTPLSGTMSLIQGRPLRPRKPSIPGSWLPLFSSAKGEDLILNLSTGVQIGGHLVGIVNED